MGKRKDTASKVRGVSIEWLDGFLLVLALVALINIVLALVWEEPSIFRILPCWIVLSAIALTQRHLENLKIVIILGGTILCYGSHQLMYLKFANLAVSSKILVSIFLVYIPLLSIFVLLTSTKSDNLRSKRDQLLAVNTRLRAEANDLLNRLNEMRNKSVLPEETEEEGNESVREKRAALNIMQKLPPA